MKYSAQILFFMLVATGFSTTAKAETALQAHVKFFDTNENGLITIPETYQGLRKLGFGIMESVKISTVVGVLVGPKTYYSMWDMFSLNITNIKQGVHDSHTGVYDAEGNFNEERLRELFSKFDTNMDQMLSQDEINAMLKANYQTSFGHSASKGEFDFLMRIASKEENIHGKSVSAVTYQTMLDMYEGRLLYQVAEKIAQQKQNGHPQTEL